MSLVRNNGPLLDKVGQEIMNSDFSENSLHNQEPSSEYVPGGYCLLDIGDTLMSTYYIIRKLGWGISSTVWLCWNMVTSGYVAIKVMKGSDQFLEDAKNEVRFFEMTGANIHDYQKYVVKCLDYFLVEGENGKHACIVFEVGELTLGEFEARNRPTLLDVKNIMRQILRGLHYLHDKCDLVHTDLKLDNILVLTSDNPGLELAVEVYEALNSTNVPRHFTGNLPREKRKIKQPIMWLTRPLFEKAVRQYHQSVQEDMTRLGMIPFPVEEVTSESSIDAASGDHHKGVCSIFREKPLKKVKSVSSYLPGSEINVKIADLGYASKDSAFEFDYIQAREYRAAEVILGAPLSKGIDIWSTACIAFHLLTQEFLFDRDLNDHEHVAKIIQVNGDIPQEVYNQCTHKDIYVEANGTLREREIEHNPMMEMLQLSGLSESDAVETLDFLLSVLHWDSDKRLTAIQCLNHSWLK